MARSSSIGSIAVTVRADTNPFTKGLTAARKQLGVFTKSINSAKAAVAGFAGVVGIGLAVRGITNLTQSIDDLVKTSRKLGVSSEALAGLRLAAEESGVSASTLDMALQRMVRRVSEAAKGTGEAKDAIRELGIDAQKLAQLAPEEQFRALADAMAQVEGQGNKVRLAMKLFDSEGVALVNTLAAGRQGLDEAAQAARDLGMAISEDQAKAIEKFNDSWNRAISGVAGAFKQLIVTIGPWLTWIVEKLELAAKAANTMAQGIRRAFQSDAEARAAAKAYVADFKARQAAAKAGPQVPDVALPAAQAIPQGSGFMGSLLTSTAGRLKTRANRAVMEGAFRAQALGKIAALFGRAVMLGAQPAPAAAGLNNASIGAVDASSRAGFAHRVRAMRSDPQLKIQRDQLAQLKVIANNTKDIAGEAAGF